MNDVISEIKVTDNRINAHRRTIHATATLFYLEILKSVGEYDGIYLNIRGVDIDLSGH